MDGSKKEVSVEKPKLLPAINTDYKEMIVSDGPMKGTTDALMQRSTFEDSNRHYNSSRENSGRISEYRNRKLVHRLSDAIIEEPKLYKTHSKNLSDGKLISGTTRQRKLWRKSTLSDENKSDDIMSSKVTKQNITDDERTSTRYTVCICIICNFLNNKFVEMCVCSTYVTHMLLLWHCLK